MVFDGNPHPTESQIIRTSRVPETFRQNVGCLYTSCRRACEQGREARPDVIVLNTPHGISLTKSVGVYMNASAKGTAEWNGCWSEFTAAIDMDTQFAQEMAECLHQDGVPVEGVHAFGRTEVPLRWGEVVPLWFLRELTAAGTKVVIVSNPVFEVRNLASVADVERTGRSLGRFLSTTRRRVLYVISGDLSHAHVTDCAEPVYLLDPRWSLPVSSVALPFDAAVEKWMTAARDSGEGDVSVKSTREQVVTWDKEAAEVAERWLQKAVDQKGQANSCGIYGVAVLHWILVTSMERYGCCFKAHFLCRLAPTYYGMIVGSFVNTNV